MEFITQCFVKNKCALTDRLILADFSYNQIIHFLPNAASAIYESTQAAGAYQTMADLLTGYPYDTNSRINVDTIAKKSGMDLFKAAIGLNAIAPVLLRAFSQKTNYQLDTGAVAADNPDQGPGQSNNKSNVA